GARATRIQRRRRAAAALACRRGRQRRRRLQLGRGAGALAADAARSRGPRIHGPAPAGSGRVVKQPKTGDVAFVGLAFLLALGVKAFYSRAGASELAFILAPSCWLAAHLGRIDLVAEQGAGYISHAHRMVAGPACAGVNFLVISFVAVILSRRTAGVRDGIRGLLIAIVAAYAATILTNGLRIILAAHLFQLGGAGWLTPERIHRLAGVVIYCVAGVTLC